MRLRVSRRTLYVLGGVVALSVAAGVAFGPIVRAQVAAEAARRHLDVQVGAVRPGWFAVRLLDVTVRPQGMDEVRAHLDEVRAHLSIGFKVEAVEVHGGDVLLHGDVERLRERYRTWREERGAGADSGHGHTLPIRGDSIALRWVDDDPDVPRGELRGFAFHRDEQGLGVSASKATLRAGRAGSTAEGSVQATEGSLELDSKGELVRAHAAALLVEWSPHASHRLTTPSAAAPGEATSSAGPPPPAVLAVRSPPQHPRPGGAPAGGRTPPPKTPDPASPLVPLPDLHAIRGRAAALATLLSDHVPEGAEASVDSMTWKITPEDERVAFTIGPGPLFFTRSPSRFEVRFSTDTHAASTALALRALLPTDGSDVSATLEGGPVSLSLLGIQEGAAGLVDVAHATVTGTAHVTLAGDGSAVSFDAELGTRGLSMQQPRLAPDVVRGIDLDVRARGAVTDAGEVRLDDFAGTLGALHVAGSGLLDQKPDHVAAAFRFELPSTPCQSLLDSFPTALLPVLQGTRMNGTFGARGRFAFDTRSLDDLELEYDVQDACRVTEVPAALAREHFKQPFPHRVYLPDGSTAEQTAGPGTMNWTPLGAISPFMQVAVMTTEDGGFPHHRGFNRPAIRASLVANLKARRFVRGASTITMQLAKNLFLSREKTLSRKLEEVVLTDYLEQAFSKDELMELYLNVIEFGPAVYGITSAAEYYFGRSPSELDLAECLFLSSLLPAPLRFGLMRDAPQPPESWMHMLRNLMQIAGKRGLISEADVAEGQSEAIAFWHGGQRPPMRPPVRARPPGQSEGEEGDAPVVVPPEDGF
jgi:hypothetical protein